MWAFGCIYAELLNGYPLFPGNSEIDMISRIGEILGSPSEENWSGIVSMPDFGKIVFKSKPPQPLSQFFPNASKSELEFLSDILKYENRLTAAQALGHSYFKDEPPLQPKQKKLTLQEKFKDSPYFNYVSLIN